MCYKTIYPPTAEFLENLTVIAVADFKGDHYGGILPERLVAPLHEGRIRTRTDHEVVCVLDDYDEVVGYRVTAARYHLSVDPISEE